ncbi:hypothetical protein [Myceligenerans indicum]|uniref:Uncharacterized protein n=1 Tax=Myceligenerans indicum TaxID=2593663 RepID=A0ABS1LQY7_9MICO|nr:hypothetical protein [Myceligenerans indicum]MBL0888716.1 hypothetical protein [Myceligenerans indicum]
MGFEALLSGYFSRGFFILVGIVGISLCVLGLVIFFRRSIGKGAPTDMAQMIAKHRGDVVEAAADVRSVPIGLLGMLCWMIVLAGAGLLGPKFAPIAPLAFSLAILSTLVTFLWIWVEKEYAVPGFLVDRRVKDVPGRRAARRKGINIDPDQFLEGTIADESEVPEQGKGEEDSGIQ